MKFWTAPCLPSCSVRNWY